MTMNNMVKEFEDRGFKVSKSYQSDMEKYRFAITKGEKTIVGYFEYRGKDSHEVRDDRQWAFIKDMCDRYDAEYNYVKTDVDAVNEVISQKTPKIKVVHFSNDVTTVIWEDGTKSQVRCQLGDRFDPEKGLALAIAKRALGNKGSWYDEIKKWIDKYHSESLEAIGAAFKDIIDGALKITIPDVSLDENCSTSAITFENHTDIRCSTCKFVKTPVTQIPCSGCDMGYSCWEPNEENDHDMDEVTEYNPIEEAYNLAIKARDGKDVNIEDIIGFLGEALDE